MAQAKSLTQNEIDQILRYIDSKKFGYRDRVMFLMTVWSGMRIKEVASVSVTWLARITRSWLKCGYQQSRPKAGTQGPCSYQRSSEWRSPNTLTASA